MNSIYVATNLAEDLIVKVVVFLSVVSVGVAVYFVMNQLSNPKYLQGGNRPIMVYLVRVVLVIKCVFRHVF
jgi:hypothetical protein